MGKLIYTAWTTLDGFIAGPEGEMDWIRGDEEMSAYEIGVVSDADTLMLGRQTYLDFAGYWPATAKDPSKPAWERTYGAKVDALHKIVVSRTLNETPWQDATILRELTVEKVTALKSAGTGGNIVMYGSAGVLQQLAGLGLVDEFHVLVHPVVLGDGRLLFENIDKRLELERVAAEPFKSGVVKLVYRPA
jgi:dihydrofolate reductase